jgi:rod shape-determining protein MreC
MIKLRHDVYARGSVPVRSVGARAATSRPGLIFVLMFVSVALLLLSRLNHVYVSDLRLQLAELMAPALTAALGPVEPIRQAGQKIASYRELFSELDRLRAENQKLRGWEWRARETERKVEQLGRLARVVEEPGLSFSTTRVVADSSGPFVRTAMLGLGRTNGMRPGYPVVNASGLVGRIVETGSRASRVLLVTDINSRIPVQVGKAGTRAVMLGDNGTSPRLGYVASTEKVENGDEVFTSGVGGLFPRGLRIGTVVADGSAFRVEPHARLGELDYVSVLFFESLALDLAEDDKPARGREVPNRRGAASVPVSDQGTRAP